MSECVLTHGVGANRERLYREAEIGLLCLQHRNRMSTTLAAILDLWTHLGFILEAGSAPKDESPKTRHLKSAEAPAPANLEALSLRDAASSSNHNALNRYAVMRDGSLARVARRGHPVKTGEVDDRDPNIRRIRASAPDNTTPIPSVPHIVASWLLLVAEERPLTATLPNSVLGQLQILMRHGDWIAAQDWVDDYITEMGELHKALSAALRDHAHTNVGRCRLPAEGREGLCGGPLLRENGSDVVRCAECKAAWVTPQERARLAISLESA